jgi:hypothetical protein
MAKAHRVRNKIIILKTGAIKLRRHFIDNLRWMCILLLFPYHAAMIFNCWGEGFYVRCAPNDPISAVIIASYTWFMPLLFALAGASSRFAMKAQQGNISSNA